MSEATTRSGASRGRGSSRGGRGGFSSRGGRSSKPNGDSNDALTPSAFDEDEDIAGLRKLYGSKVEPIKDMFQGWSDVDILYALQEADGDPNLAVERIAHGAVAQWGEVSKPKKSARAKAKEAPLPSQTTDAHLGGTRPSRGGRNVTDSGRGRGRGTDRGGRARARPAHPATNGTRKETTNLSVPTEESNAWDAQKKNGTEQPSTTTTAPAEQPAAAPEAPKAAAPAGKTWASMLRQATAPKAPPKPKEPLNEKPAETIEPLPSADAAPAEPPKEPEPAPEPEPTTESSEPAQETPAAPAANVDPSGEPLTESNLDQVDDTSRPTATDTAASTAADSWAPVPSDARTGTTQPAPPQPSTQTQPAPAVPGPGFAAVTPKMPAGRPQHYQRRILDQEEAVRMPGNREVDRAAVQFGAFSLSGAEEDIDGEREEAETRAQPPPESPVAQPRASLPPVTQPQAVDPLAAQKAAAPTAPAAAPTAPAAQAQAQQTTLPQAQPTVPAAQPFGRFGHAAQEGAPGFAGLNQGAPATTQAQFDAFQAQQATQLPHSAGAFSSAPGDFSSYYTADHPSRLPYNYYGQQYGQQQPGQQDAAAAAQQAQPQRSFSGYTNPSQADNLSQYPQSGVAALHNQSRFGGVATDPQSSGHTTPNPPAHAQVPQQPAGQTAASQPQTHGQQSYPYGSHPYFNNPYYHSYYAQAYGQGYGASPYKGGVYGAPYNMPPQAPYDHTSSPAGGFQSSLHRENNGIGSGLGDYGRVSAAQAQAGLGGTAFGGMHDAFGRGPSSFQSQGGPGFTAPSQGGPPSSAADDLKPYVDTKTAAGPSPSLGGARPGSAANNAPAQSGLPPQTSGQMGGYGGYPSHLQQGLHGAGAYGMGGASAAGQHGSTPYGSYGQGGFGSGAYYGAGQQQGGQQQPQRGGWGGNYNH